MTEQHALARHFHSLHVPGTPLTLANAWDAASARLVAATGAPAVATTSAGVAWGLGAADGNRLHRDEAIALIARVAGAVEVPVTADIESGFGATPDEVAETVARVVAAGAVGVNIEDSPGPDGAALRPAAEQAERIAAARSAADAAGVPLFINARTDVYLLAVGDERDRLDETLRRAGDYLEAGADGVFVPGTTDPDVVGALTKDIAAPVNIMAGPGAPTVERLAGLGVARISLGSAVAEAAYAVALRAARELATTGTYAHLADPVPYGELNALMAGGRG
ncbi:isocitrate lyase/phosphoenolpyruvate mutase family protein [Streptomyces sp. LX-29]|uniref:isocitrate lyase/PEP mutase family protein n=1 Tax=Streptomyces sp. LX-29 TaxID=2900152 RepID=UPI00240E4778|nr:isocitrate lyase/phosphoenolpyruvate mutase family protein [Streptomyces sp. LX-29]WFB08386.1 isocitrate lyase/phosphoenolpyruvate mutase family protein [Streptomyces sp. LX-29]